MNLALAENTFEIPAIEGEEHHFWISSAPLFSSSLIMVPPVQESEEGGEVELSPYSAVLRFYDADGYLFNEAKVCGQGGELSLIELGSFMESCKIHSGMKHAHLEILSDAGLTPQLRIEGTSSSSVLDAGISLSLNETVCVPVSFAPQRRTYVALLNTQGSVAKIKCRMFAQKRVPEVHYEVPPYGVSLINLEVEFPDFFSKELSTQAYLRLTGIADSELRVSVIEEFRADGQRSTFGGLS